MHRRAAATAALRRAGDRVDRGASLRNAAAMEGVPRSTLSRRLRAGSESPARAGKPLLSMEEENAILRDFLASKVGSRDAATPAEIREKVIEVLNAKGDLRRPGVNYVRSLLRRHPEVSQRMEGLKHGPSKRPPDPSEVEEFLSTYETLCRREECLQPGQLLRVWGADEVGEDASTTNRRKLLVPTGYRGQIEKQQLAQTVHLTHFPMHSAAGVPLPVVPVLVSAARVPANVLELADANWKAGKGVQIVLLHNSKGYQSTETLSKLLDTAFFPNLPSSLGRREAATSKWLLLVLDWHNSRHAAKHHPKASCGEENSRAPPSEEVYCLRSAR